LGSADTGRDVLAALRNSIALLCSITLLVKGMIEANATNNQQLSLKT